MKPSTFVACLLSTWATAMAMAEYDVIVVGAGVSGLATAFALQVKMMVSENSGWGVRE
jgi:ribulose 1,5-bisphosphate synthetase/thiazole synthase